MRRRQRESKRKSALGCMAHKVGRIIFNEWKRIHHTEWLVERRSNEWPEKYAAVLVVTQFTYGKGKATRKRKQFIDAHICSSIQLFTQYLCAWKNTSNPLGGNCVDAKNSTQCKKNWHHFRIPSVFPIFPSFSFSRISLFCLRSFFRQLHPIFLAADMPQMKCV